MFCKVMRQRTHPEPALCPTRSAGACAPDSKSLSRASSAQLIDIHDERLLNAFGLIRL
jgi:hypothetical protein